MQPQQADPVVLALILAQFDAIDAGTIELAEAIAAQIEANSSNGTVQNSALILATAAVLIDAFFVDFAKQTKATQVQIAQHMVEKYLPGARSILTEAGAPLSYRVKTANQMLQYPSNLDKTFYSRPNDSDGVRFDHRIKTVRLGTEQTVRNIVNVGKRRGMSSQQIAADVRTYLRGEYGGPGRKLNPTELQREAALLNKTAKPKNIANTKLPYSAKRIARSEAGNTYRAAETEMYRGTVFEQDKYDWVLSNTHQDRDACDEYAQGSPYTAGQRPHSHPNCNCAFIKRPVSVNELKRRLKASGVL